ncbi:MAG TPA: type II toxin-antitoxin system MqsA family antitoxin [Candidatus Limnocylindrales bacterium]|nr:type II toxin-antitoxin system MqsA family antitoxin [Candidatus Limnocylindrales bacterium]
MDSPQETKMNLNCPVCGGQLKNDTIRENVWVDGKLLVIDNLPSRVCMRCDESIVDFKTMKKIEKIIEKFKHKEIDSIKFTAYEVDSMAVALA